jgi:hypothetical protein
VTGCLVHLSGWFCGVVGGVALELQADKESRIPPLRAVIADGDADCLLLPDQDEQPLAPRDSRVDQIALEQHVVLRG